MNKKTFKGLAAVVALFSASMVNAATISLTATPTTVNATQSFTLDVSGSDFTTILTGSLLLSWDTTFVTLDTTEGEIITALTGLGFDGTFSSATIDLVAGTADIGIAAPIVPDPAPVDTTGNTPPGSIDFFSLSFTALAATTPTTNITSAIGTSGGWSDGTFNPFTNTYGLETVTVNAVPIPATVWLFGSGLLGLAGVARRTAAAA